MSRPSEPPPETAGDATRTSVGTATFLTPGSRFADRYRIVELIGVGGMGMVYHAFDERLDLPVALKLLRPERAGDRGLRERFRQELILARQVSHRHVVRIHDLGEEGDVYFLSMDYVAGRSLRQVIEEEGPLAPERVLEIGRQLAEALDAAHREGVVHRDLKPGNVLLDEEGRVYVTDFGIASSASAVGLTATGSVIGTPDYLAPEQARGERVDHRVDLYALGLILFEMSTRRLPFAGGSLTEVLAQHISGRPARLAEVATEAGLSIPPALSAIVDRLLERDPDARYQDASTLAADLAAGRPPSRAWSPRRFFRRWISPATPGRGVGGWLAGLGALALAAGIAGLITFVVARFGETTPGDAEPRHAVAVLPLVDETGRPELAWVSTGLAEVIAGELAESAALRVVDALRVVRTVEDLKIDPASIPESEQLLLAELLDVDRLVLGRVRPRGEGLRVDARLVSVDRPELPAEAFSVEIESTNDVFPFVERLGGELRARLGESPVGTLGVTPSVDAVAFGAYAEGLETLWSGDPVAAMPAFERAVESAPDFPAAWARLAEVSDQLGFGERAEEAAERGVELLGADADPPTRSGRLARRLHARRALVDGEIDDAVERLQELVESFPHDMAGRLELAEIYGAAGRYDEASSELREVVERDPQHPDAWYLLGKFAILTGANRRAVDEYLTRALVIHNRLDDTRGRADVVNAFGVAYQKLGDFEEAEARYREAAELRRRLGDLRGQSSSLFNLAMLRARRGDLDAAQADLESVLGVREEIGDHVGVASAHNHIGHFEERRGDYRQALHHFEKGLEGRREAGDLRAVAESLNNVGFMEFLLGRYDEATERWNEALKLHREGGNVEGESLVAQSLARLALVRGRWESALETLLATLEASRADGRRDLEAMILGLLGEAAHHQGRYRAALDSYAEGLAIFREIGEIGGLVDLGLDEAELWLDLGLVGRAEERLEEVAKWLDEQDHHEQRATLRRLEGERSLRLGRPDEASAAFETALATANASGSRTVELWARLGLGEATSSVEPLRRVVEESERLDHVRLRLRGALALAEARRGAGDLAAAEATLRDAAELAGARAPQADAYRIHGLLAEVLEARGRGREAVDQRARATRQVERVRESLDETERAAFDRLPEVQSLERERTARNASGRESGPRDAA